MTILDFLILLILLCATLQDCRFYMVYDRFFVALYLLLFFHNSFSIELFIITNIFLVIFYFFYKKDMIGGADIKLYIFILLYYGFLFFSYTLTFSNIIGYFFCILTKKKRIPFIPFITLGILLTYYIF